VVGSSWYDQTLVSLGGPYRYAMIGKLLVTIQKTIARRLPYLRRDGDCNSIAFKLFIALLADDFIHLRK
jgi:hypothetical protein